MAEVLVRFTAGHPYDFNARSSIFVPVEKWSGSVGALSLSFKRFVAPETIALLSLQEKLDDLRSFILRRYMDDPSLAVTRGWLVSTIEAFHHPTQAPARILFEELVLLYADSSDLAESTKRQYKVIQQMFHRFGVKRHVIYADSITADDLDEFVAFISKEQRIRRGKGATTIKRGRNTIASKLKKIRAVCRFGVRRGLITKNPFDDFSVPSEVYGTPTYISIQERDLLAATDMPTTGLTIQRDVFVFQCHVGCRVSDLISLKKSSVIEVDGVRQIQYVQQKQKRSRPITISVPLDDTAASIVDKYAEWPGDALLPFISDDKYNDAIKSIFRVAGITRLVIVLDPRTLEPKSVPICDIASSHMARRTFAGNMFKSTKSERIVSSMTGWAPGSKSLARYTSVDDEMKVSVLSELDQSHKNPSE